MKIAPCKDCKKRTLGCHGRCDKYLNWKKEHDEARKLLQKNEGYRNIRWRSMLW